MSDRSHIKKLIQDLSLISFISFQQVFLHHLIISCLMFCATQYVHPHHIIMPVFDEILQLLYITLQSKNIQEEAHST